jgi:hypothetical protein
MLPTRRHENWRQDIGGSHMSANHRIASADFSRNGKASSATRHSGLDPESSSVPLDSGVRRNDGFHAGAPRLPAEEAA